VGARIVDFLQAIVHNIAVFVGHLLGLAGLVLVVAPVAIFGLAVALASAAGYLALLREHLWATGEPSIPRPVGAGAEPAWPRYFRGQARDDLRRGWAEGLDRAVEAGTRLRRRVFLDESGEERYVSAPVAVIAVLGGIVGMPTGFLLAAVVAGFHALVVVVLTAGSSVVVPLARMASWAQLRARRIRVTCPACYRDIACPVYACPRCGAKHHDIRPGRYGVLQRACRCGTRLPTLVPAAGLRLASHCPKCDQRLPDWAGGARELVVSMLGPIGAGKTRLAISMLMALEGSLDQVRERMAHRLTAETWERYHVGRNAITAGEPTPPTGPNPPLAYSLSVRPNRGPAWIIHIFDASGSWFHSPPDKPEDKAKAGLQELAYLSRTQCFVYVVDPLTIDKLLDELPAELQDRMLDLRCPRAAPASRTFDHTVRYLRDMGIRTRRTRLAVPVTKADELGDQFLLAGGETRSRDPVAGALGKLRLGNLVRTSGSFKNRFFYTAAVVNGDKMDPNVLELTEWVVPPWRPWTR
jgi:hypothetical protein